MEILRRFKQLRELTVSEWRILLLSMLILPVIAVSLRIKGLKWTQCVLSKRLPSVAKSSLSQSEQLKHAESIARMVTAAANHGLYRTNCLKIALTTWWLLKRKGIEAKLKIGTNIGSGKFSAHAWIEHQDTILIEGPGVREHYSTLYVFN